MKKEEFLKALAKRITLLREERGMTMTDLGKKIGKGYRSIARLEKGNTNPSLVYLIEVSKGLDVNISTLVSELP